MKIIKINGIGGICLFVFCACCLVTGFVLFPGWLCMVIWNKIFSYFPQVTQMNIAEGIILWAIIALSLYVLNAKKSLLNFVNTEKVQVMDIRQFIDNLEKEKKIFEKNNEQKTENSDEKGVLK